MTDLRDLACPPKTSDRLTAGYHHNILSNGISSTKDRIWRSEDMNTRAINLGLYVNFQRFYPCPHPSGSYQGVS